MGRVLYRVTHNPQLTTFLLPLGHARCYLVSSVVQANCRTRFTAADFDFIVRTLSRSERDAVSLVKLLTDADALDALLDHDALADAILSQNSHLAISPQLYFYVLTRRVLRRAGLADRALCDYLASLLDEFSRTAALRPPPGAGPATRGLVYLSDLMLALREASPSQAFFLQARMGDYTLFLTGIFHENIERRRARRGAPGCSYYEAMGRESYRAVAQHEVARHRGLTNIFNGLAEQFHEVRLALNQLADRLFNLGDDGLSSTSAGLALLG